MNDDMPNEKPLQIVSVTINGTPLQITPGYQLSPGDDLLLSVIHDGQEIEQWKIKATDWKLDVAP